MPKPGPRTTYRYSRDFKTTAVRLSQLQASIPLVVTTLQAIGYHFANQTSGEISGFDSKGERRTFASERDAMRFLTEGNSLQLWLNDSEDIFMSVVDGELWVYFDGYTEKESATIMRRLREDGLLFRLEQSK